MTSAARARDEWARAVNFVLVAMWSLHDAPGSAARTAR